MEDPCCATNILTQKRGDTFTRTITYKRCDSSDCAVDSCDCPRVNLTGATIVAFLRDNQGKLIDTITATILPQTGSTLGQYTLTRAYSVTATWPVLRLNLSIQYTFADGTRRTTDPTPLQILQEY